MRTSCKVKLLPNAGIFSFPRWRSSLLCELSQSTSSGVSLTQSQMNTQCVPTDCSLHQVEVSQNCTSFENLHILFLSKMEWVSAQEGNIIIDCQNLRLKAFFKILVLLLTYVVYMICEAKFKCRVVYKGRTLGLVLFMTWTRLGNLTICSVLNNRLCTQHNVSCAVFTV